MQQAVTTICLTGFAAIACMLLLLRLLVALSGARLRLARLPQLHRNQAGSVQSLSFVLTLPLFIMIMMGIVQASQIMVAQIVVEYAALAAARSAAVWIPAHLADGSDDGRNRLAALELIESGADGATYQVETGMQMGSGAYSSPKVFRVAMAAAQACMPIAPSRATGATISQPGGEAYNVVLEAFGALAPDSQQNGAIAKRLKNKLAYSLSHTTVDIRIFHPSYEPALDTDYDDSDQLDWLYSIDSTQDMNDCGMTVNQPVNHPEYAEDPAEYQFNELGWQDVLTVTVHHNLALLPGPGRMLAKLVKSPTGQPDDISTTIQQEDDLYTWPLSATATISNEGQKPVLRYEYQTFGLPY